MDPPPSKISAKPPLITPSASPPPYRQGTLSHRGRTESVPPLKRQRTASTPRPATPSSSSASQDPVDILEQRKASTMRLLDFWDSLASYTRPLDEDDLVNVLTGEVTRDVGVLRSSSKLEFGSLAAPVEDDASSEGSDTREDLEKDEYDVDELDAFLDNSSDAGVSDADTPCDLQMGAQIMPLVPPLGPADTDDLREFMEAERKRRELYGSEDEQDDERYSLEDHEAVNGAGVGVQQSLNIIDDDKDNDDAEEERVVEHEEEAMEHGEEAEGREDEPEPSQRYGHYSDHIEPLDDGSDDELDNWDIDDSNIVHPVLKQDSVVSCDEDSDSEIEIIEVHQPSKPPKTRTSEVNIRGASSKPRPQSVRIPTPPRQLYTPPQSNSSSGPSATPVDDSVDSLTRPITPSTSRPSHIHSPSKKSSLRQNKDFQNDISNSTRHVQEKQVHRIDLSKIRNSSSPVKTTPKKAKTPSASPSKQGFPNSNLKPFVLLTPRKASVPQKSTVSSRSDNTPMNSPNPSSTPFKFKAKAKQTVDSTKASKPTTEATVHFSPSKQKSVQLITTKDPSPDGESDSPVPTSSSPSKPSRSQSRPSRRASEETFSYDSRRTPELPTSREASQQEQFISPTFPSPPIYRKRKRTPSDTSMESPETKPRETVHGMGRHLALSDSHPSTYRSSNAAQHPPPPHGYAAIPDPRAQLIITQAMQQLSALVGAPWIPPPQYHDNRLPQTPSHRRSSSRLPAGTPFQTPTHQHHPYPYSYDPNLSHATLPPDSPEVSSPEKAASTRRKSLVRRSRSKGRRVSFHLEEDEITRDYESNTEAGYSSPSDRHTPKAPSRQQRIERPKHDDRPKNHKGKGRAETPYLVDPEIENDSRSDVDVRGRSSRTRGQTPGPRLDSPNSRAPSRTEHKRHDFPESSEKQGSRRKHREN
ncbi:hypothetical protein BDN70DRAFT_889859 [Pholiota conissans]|uniref:Uncharacterized protein n=1 Tax=Pholiota conissans TaxID=109636 RepID=A0A9P5ZF23_9AGAR|nr:hypothetical protein BDN70DRAFT_889859 [Pholiota conissans]